MDGEGFSRKKYREVPIPQTKRLPGERIRGFMEEVGEHQAHRRTLKLEEQRRKRKEAQDRQEVEMITMILSDRHLFGDSPYGTPLYFPDHIAKFKQTQEVKEVEAKPRGTRERLIHAVGSMKSAYKEVDNVGKLSVQLAPILKGLKKEFTAKRRKKLSENEFDYTERANAAIHVPTHRTLEDGWKEHDRRWHEVQQDIVNKLETWQREAKTAFDMETAEKSITNLNTLSLDTVPEFRDAHTAMIQTLPQLKEAHKAVDEGIKKILEQLNNPDAVADLAPNIDFIDELSKRMETLQKTLLSFETTLTRVKQLYKFAINLLPDTVRGRYKSFSAQTTLPG